MRGLALIAVFLIGLLLLRWMVAPAPIQEGFAIFGIGGGSDSDPIPYNKLINDTYTANELVAWKANWLAISVDQRNGVLAEWDGIDPKEQHKMYTQAVAQKQEREAIENAVASVPAPPPPPCAPASPA